MRSATALSLLALPLALALAGCATGSASEFQAGPVGMVAAPSSVAGHGTAEARDGHVVVRMDEDYFSPTLIRAPAGSRLAVTVENVGSVSHSFDLVTTTQKVDVVVPRGRHATVHVRVPRVGRLLFFCKFHYRQGMAGYIEPT